jgi:hypothetical protein
MAGGYSGALALAPRRRRNHRGLCRSHNPWWSRPPDCRLPLRQELHKLGTATEPADSLLAGADESEQRRTPAMPNLCLCTGRMPTTVRPTVAHTSMPTRSMRPARSARSLSATRRLARRYRNGDRADTPSAGLAWPLLSGRSHAPSAFRPSDHRPFASGAVARSAVGRPSSGGSGPGASRALTICSGRRVARHGRLLTAARARLSKRLSPRRSPLLPLTEHGSRSPVATTMRSLAPPDLRIRSTEHMSGAGHETSPARPIREPRGQRRRCLLAHESGERCAPASRRVDG